MAQYEWVFGMHTVFSILENRPETVSELWLQQSRDDEKTARLERLVRKEGVGCQRVDRKKLDEHAQGSNHQGVMAKVRAMPSLTDNDLLNALDNGGEVSPFYLILDTVTDPHNLGACLRAADAFGVQGIIAPKDKSVGLTATARKVASGAAETVPFYQVTNLARTMKAMQDRGVWITGTAIDETAVSLFDANLVGPIAVVMGAEGKGLRRLTQETCDTLVYLPMSGHVDSLNVGVATGVLLFEVVRQRQI